MSGARPRASVWWWYAVFQPSPHQPQGGVHVLDDGLGGDPPDVTQRPRADERCRSAPEGSDALVVATGQQDMEEDPLLSRVTVVIESPRVVVRLWALHQGDRRVVEPPERRGQKGGQGNVVAVQDGDDVDLVGALRGLPVHHVQRVVHVAGLGMIVHIPAYVPGAVGSTKVGDPFSITVVQHPGLMGGLELARSSDGWSNDFDRLVVRRKPYGDRPARGQFVDGLRGEGVDVPQGDDPRDQIPGAGEPRTSPGSMRRFDPSHRREG